MNSVAAGNGAQWVSPDAVAPFVGGSSPRLWDFPVHAGAFQTWEKEAVKAKANEGELTLPLVCHEVAWEG